METQILYDGDCPMCTQAVCLRDASGQAFATTNARAASALREEATAAGINLDQGFMVKHEGKLYAGPEAAHQLALLLPPSGWRNHLTRLMFGSMARTRLFYPFCRLARRAALAVRGKGLIRNLPRS